MKAAFFREHGGPDRVEFGDLPEPAAGGSPEKLDREKALGANAGIDHGNTDFSREIRKLTGKRGVDVVLDKVKPVVDAVFPLSEAGEALRRLEEKRQFGKIGLRVD